MGQKSIEMILQPFTEEEMTEIGLELAGVCYRVKKQEDVKKRVTNRVNQKLRELTKIRDEIAAAMKAGGQLVETECDMVYDRVAGKVRFYVDGAEVKERPMNGDELEQTNLFEGNGDADPGKGFVICSTCKVAVVEGVDLCPGCGALME